MTKSTAIEIERLINLRADAEPRGQINRILPVKREALAERMANEGCTPDLVSVTKYLEGHIKTYPDVLQPEDQFKIRLANHRRTLRKEWLDKMTPLQKLEVANDTTAPIPLDIVFGGTVETIYGMPKDAFGKLTPTQKLEMADQYAAKQGAEKTKKP